MELSAAVLNYQVLKKLTEYEKLCVKDQTQIRVDERWLKGLRRTVSGDSKQDILIPIEQTFDVLMLERYYPANDIDSTLSHLLDVFSVTYPGYDDLQNLIKKLKRNNQNYNRSNTKVIHVDPSYAPVDDDIWNGRCCVATKSLFSSLREKIRSMKIKK